MNPNNQRNVGVAERSNKLTVTERALFARLKRSYHRDGMVLKTCRENSQWFRDLGRYYAADENNHLVGTDIALEQEARERGVLRRHEEVV